MRPWRNWIAHRSSEPRVEGSNPSGRTHFIVRSLRTVAGRIVPKGLEAERRKPSGVASRKSITVVRTANASIKAERRKPSGVASRKSVTGGLAPNRFQIHRTGHRRSRSECFHKSGTAQAVRCRISQISQRRACAQPLSSRPYRSARSRPL
jgi:hypothetical protein